jgi:sporulation protein YlmC with PRC-barrel domain
VIEVVMRLSKLYGKQIYNTKGFYVGYVDEVLIEISGGEGKVLALGLPGQKVGIPYDRVTAIGDIILVKAKEG